MQLKVARNAKRGIIFGIINKMVVLLLPFLVQTAMIRSLGAEYLGVKGLFTSILQVLSLAELGFGTAVVYSMYKPIAEGDNEAICALLSLFKRIYRYIGLAIAVIGCILLPLLPMLIKGDCPKDLNIYIVFSLYLINTVLSYWLFAYRSCLFSAFQRTDIISIINTVTSAISYVAQIVILVATRNYYIFLLVAIVCTILNNTLVYYYSKKVFPEYNPSGIVDSNIKREIKEKVKGLLVYKICGVTRNSFDNIFVSMFLGLTTTAMYSNYYYILSSVSGFMGVACSSLIAGIGNKMNLYSPKDNREDMKKLDNVYMILSGWCMTCMICLYQPFMELWVGKEMVFPFPIAVMFGVYFYLLKMGDIRALYADAAGLWWENRFRTIGEAVSNIILNFVLVRIWGVYGIIIATIITIFIFGYLGSAAVIYRYYFKAGLLEYYFCHFKLLLENFSVCIISYLICTLFAGSNILTIIARAGVCCLLTPSIYCVVILIDKQYSSSFRWLLGKIKNK